MRPAIAKTISAAAMSTPAAADAEIDSPGDREALLVRSVQRFTEIYGVYTPSLADDLRRIHDEFFAHRTGRAVRIEAR